MAKKKKRQTEELEYRVLHQVAAGGMAEIFLAEQQRRGHATTLVALKRVRPHLRGDSAILGMLRDEIRLGLRCHHPNVVETLGSIESEEQTYAVLEYVDGLDLALLRDALKARGKRFTRAQAVHISIELCKGLDHLHTLTDERGRPLNVVHRDVTPPNVLLGIDGAVKLCDFGLTKSNAERTLTEPGLVKGKFSYLAPETALGQTPDLRADLFSVGIMLWEMLAMSRLFSAKTDYETVQLIQRAEVPPLSRFDADVDDVLEELVRKCLSRDPEQRFPSAKALYNALSAYADWQELQCEIGPLVAEAKATGATQLPNPQSATAVGS